MVLVNKVLNILILVGALLSCAYSYLLFERRTELRDRGEKLADAIASTVKDLDVKSGTTYSAEINRNDFSGGANGETLAGGPLGWAYFHASYDSETQSHAKFENVLEEVKKQAQDIRGQRDLLADGLSQHAGLFEQEGFEIEAFQEVASYEESLKDLYAGLEDIRKRDDAIITKIDETATKIGQPIDKDLLTSTDTYDEPLISFGFHVGKLKERVVNYVDTLAQVVDKISAHEFEVDAQLLKDDNAYAGELTSLLNDFANINEKLTDYERYKVEFLEAKDTLEKTIEALETSNDNLATLESKLANLEADYASLNKNYNQLAGSANKAQPSQLKKLEGTVLNVNYDWNYIIINLGRNDNLPEDLEMTVAREKEYICKVLVTKVFEKHSVAEILPKMKIGSVIEGDRVIF